jgi:hypothetical protein
MTPNFRIEALIAVICDFGCVRVRRCGGLSERVRTISTRHGSSGFEVAFETFF